MLVDLCIIPIKLDVQKQKFLIKNDKNIADDDFISLPGEKQISIKNNFINTQLINNEDLKSKEDSLKEKKELANVFMLQYSNSKAAFIKNLQKCSGFWKLLNTQGQK